jgi:flagellar biosynthesis protein FlhB
MSVSTEVGAVYRGAWRIYRAHPAALLLPGAVLFLLFGVPSALLHEVNSNDGVATVALVLAVQTLGFTSSYLYYGYCEEVADQSRSGEVSIARALEDTRQVLFKLIAVSVIVELLVGVGLLLFIVPGVLLAVRWAVVAPAASFERVWPRRAMGRSRELVRGHLRLVLLTAITVLVLEQIASTVGDSLGAELFSDDTIGRVIGDVAGDLLVGPFAGLVTAILYFRLREQHEGPA